MRKPVAVKSDFLAASCLYVVSDRRRTNHSGQKPRQPVDDHWAIARSRTKSRRVDKKDEKDPTLVDRRSSRTPTHEREKDRIYRLIERKRLVSKLAHLKNAGNSI